MKIMVCIKQVPDSAEVEVDAETGVLKREGTGAKLNPYDLYAVEEALALRACYGGTVTAISMGPAQAEAALRESLWMGVDSAVLLSDRRFAGSDVAATSAALAEGIRVVGSFDLILCGKQTTDGDTAQVGPEIAERLGIPHAANVTFVELTEKEVTVRYELDGAEVAQCLPLPSLLTVEKGINTPRLPSYLRMRESVQNTIRVLSLDELADKDARHYGITGSPTRVERIFAPEKNDKRHLFEGDAKALAGKLAALLREEKFV